MRSGATDLLGRVTRAATVSAALAALVAAACASIVADRVIAAAEEQRLRDQAAAILSELAPMSSGEAAAEALTEAHELAQLGLRLAVFENGSLIAGDRTLAHATVGCDIADGIRRCAVSRGPRTCVVGAPALLSGRIATFVVASTAALLVAVVLGVLSSRRAARWAVEPLTALANEVASADPSTLRLGPDRGVREVDALRHALASAWARLADALSTARRFSADAAHELRTPLTALSAELELLEERITDPDLMNELRRARATTARLARLTERLLVLARAADGLPGGDAVDVLELATEIAARLPSEDRARVTVSGDTGLVRGDESLVASLIENAITNALRHGKGMVAIAVGTGAGIVTLDVRDEGPGIAPDDRERLFEPFVRGTAAGRVDGHGIGLALISHVALAHGGTARFEDSTRGAHLHVTMRAWKPRDAS